jgi:cobyrinic acid a,c-diamide synthase
VPAALRSEPANAISEPHRSPARCRALLISAPSSGSGKTTVTAALARRLVKDGQRVRVFKTGPDFLDPMLLEAASGAPVYQLDLWMVGEVECARLLHDAAREADVLLVEGVMGLYDGDPSSADLARHFGLPVAVVIDASAMAQTFAAIAEGLLRHRPLQVGGVIANRVASERHAAMLTEGMDSSISLLGTLPRMDDAAFPERHLGLVQAGEVGDLDRRIDALAEKWLPRPVPLPAPVEFASSGAAPAPPRLLDGVHIAVARDSQSVEFGDGRLRGLLNQHRGTSPEALATSLRLALREFAQGGEQSDDITVLALCYQG